MGGGKNLFSYSYFSFSYSFISQKTVDFFCWASVFGLALEITSRTLKLINGNIQDSQNAVKVPSSNNNVLIQ